MSDHRGSQKLAGGPYCHRTHGRHGFDRLLLKSVAEGVIRIANKPVPILTLPGDLVAPKKIQALVVFAHGSGSSRLIPRNRSVARAPNKRAIADLTVRFADAQADHANVFDIPLLAGRLVEAVLSLDSQNDLEEAPVGLFGTSTGAAAQLDN